LCDDASSHNDGGASSDATFDIGSLCGHDDCDGDGYSFAEGDCNDNDKLVGPEAYDFTGDGVDNDCNGTVDDPIETCETIPTMAPGTPTDFVRAADMCAQKSKTHAGTPFDPMIRAAWGSVSGYGPGQTLWTSTTKPAQQTNIVSSFGMNQPRRGRTMFGLANGPWGTHTPRSSMPLDPMGFRLNDACMDIPLMGMDCSSLSFGGSTAGLSVQDWAELTVWVKVPANAQGLSFDFSFFTSEFNEYWNAAFNDAFFVLVTNKQISGQNVAKDAQGLAVTVNSGFFQLCVPQPGPPNVEKTQALANCVGVAGDPQQQVFGTLAGTYYDGAGEAPYDGTATTVINGTPHKYIYGGGSGWLTTKFAVTPGESFSMRVIIHDTFDGLKDSAALFDAFRWEQTASGAGTQRPPR
jgi:hypothetical protein